MMRLNPLCVYIFGCLMRRKEIPAASFLHPLYVVPETDLIFLKKILKQNYFKLNRLIKVNLVNCDLNFKFNYKSSFSIR
jgi:hypothetical protein